MKHINLFNWLQEGSTLNRVGMILALCLITITQVWGADVTATYSHSSSSLQPVSFSSNDYVDAMTITTTGTVGGSSTTGARCNITGKGTSVITFTFTAKSDFSINGFTFASYVNNDDVKNPVITYKKNSGSGFAFETEFPATTASNKSAMFNFSRMYGAFLLAEPRAIFTPSLLSF